MPKNPNRACQATFQLKKGTKIKFDRVVAYEYKSGDNNSIAVLFADTDISIDRLKTALQDHEGSDDSFRQRGQYLNFSFSKTGQLRSLSAYADHTSLSMAGEALTGDLIVKDRRVVGKARLNSGGDTAEASFDVPLLEVVIKPAEPKLADRKPPKSPESKDPKNDSSGDVASDTPKKVPAAPAPNTGPNVYTLPIPKDAANLTYRKLTGQINFSSPSDIKTLSDFYASGLEPLGWTRTSKDLVSTKSASLKRAQGDATLSVFVRPADKGCTVQIISKGLNWDEQKPPNDSNAK